METIPHCTTFKSMLKKNSERWHCYNISHLERPGIVILERLTVSKHGVKKLNNHFFAVGVVAENTRTRATTEKVEILESVLATPLWKIEACWLLYFSGSRD